MPDLLTPDVTISDFGLSKYEEFLQNEDFFLSSQGQDCVLTAYEFFRCFISGDILSMKEYLSEPEHYYGFNQDSSDERRDLTDVELLNLHVIAMINLDFIEITFEYQMLNDSCTYIHIALIFRNDEWKAKDFFLEK